MDDVVFGLLTGAHKLDKITIPLDDLHWKFTDAKVLKNGKWFTVCTYLASKWPDCATKISIYNSDLKMIHNDTLCETYMPSCSHSYLTR